MCKLKTASDQMFVSYFHYNSLHNITPCQVSKMFKN